MLTIPICACGYPMTATRVPDVFMCPNCDQLQPQEYCRVCGPLDECHHDTKRRSTYRDKTFRLTWQNRIRSIYGSV